MGAVYAGLLLERSDAFCATTPHHQIVRTVCQITSSLGHPAIRYRYLPFLLFKLEFAIWLLLVMTSLISMAVSDFLKHS